MVSSSRKGRQSALICKFRIKGRENGLPRSCSQSYIRKVSIVTAKYLVATMLAFFVSCQVQNHVQPIEHHMDNLREFRNTLIKQNQFSLEDIPGTLINLRELEDSVLIHALEIEDESGAKTLSQVATISGEIIFLLNQTIDAQKMEFLDFINLQTALSEASKLSYETKLAQQFFESLDTIAIPIKSSIRAEKNYIDFLKSSAECDYQTWYEVLKFFAAEDSYFRMYLKNYLKHPVSDCLEIIENTESVCKKLADISSQGNYDQIFLQAYLSARTNRRLLQNSEVCLSLIESGSIKNQHEAATALLGALAPFTTFSKAMVSARTGKQIHMLENIGERLPHAISILEDKGYDVLIATDSIPNLLMKDYISFYHNN